MKFVKFDSIDRVENIVPEKDRDYQFAIANAKRWVITEKIDGSNFSILVDRNCDDFKVARRNDIITDSNSDTWDLNAGKERFNYVVQCIRQYMDTVWADFDQITVYGEWFGKGIMKRIYYGDEKYFRMFNAIAIKDKEVTPLSFEEFAEFIDHFDLRNHFVPIIGYEETYEAAIKYPNNTASRLSPTGSIMEGIVIEPFDLRTTFKVKSKNDQFCEVSNHPCTEPDSKQVVTLCHDFRNYVNINRMYSVFSKLGYPEQGIRAANTYLRALVDDAKEDFIKDHKEFLDLDKKDQRKVTNVGKLTFTLFTQALKDLA